MKYFKLFEELDNEAAKKYPYLFNIFVDSSYVEPKDYESINAYLKNNGNNISKPIGTRFNIEDFNELEKEYILNCLTTERQIKHFIVNEPKKVKLEIYKKLLIKITKNYTQDILMTI